MPMPSSSEEDSESEPPLDSLKLEIDLRIKGANAIPKGIGRQLEQESYKKAPNITPGDLYDKNGKRTYFKPADE